MRLKRDYKDEYKKFHSSTSAKKARAGRNLRRRRALKSGLVSKGDGKDIHHFTSGGKTVIRVEPKAVNRGRKEKSRLKGSSRK
jgi:hypothetical protein